MKTIRIQAKCSDLFFATLKNDDGTREEYEGYVPGWLPNPKASHGGDYVDLTIDIETGTIVNWKKPSQEELNDTFGYISRIV